MIGNTTWCTFPESFSTLSLHRQPVMESVVKGSLDTLSVCATTVNSQTLLCCMAWIELLHNGFKKFSKFI